MARCEVDHAEVPALRVAPDFSTLPQSGARYRLYMTWMDNAEATPVPIDVSDVSDVAVRLTERLSVLDGLSTRPLSEHPDVYQQLHAELQATLAEIDTA